MLTYKVNIFNSTAKQLSLTKGLDTIDLGIIVAYKFDRMKLARRVFIAKLI